MRELLLLVMVLLTGCGAQETAQSVLALDGYTDITTRPSFECPAGDDVRVGFSAIAPTGEHASGSVCCVGWVAPDCRRVP